MHFRYIFFLSCLFYKNIEIYYIINIIYFFKNIDLFYNVKFFKFSKKTR